MSQPTPIAIELLVRTRWALPIEPSASVLEHAAIAIDGGRILDIGPAARIAERYRAREDVRLDRRHVALPGFVDAHVHAPLALLRGSSLRASAPESFVGRLAAGAQRWLGPEFVRAGAREAIATMIRRGITSFANLHFYPDEVARLAEELRLRIAIGLPVACEPSPWAASPVEYLERAAALWDAYKAHPWVRPYFAADERLVLDGDATARLRRSVDQLDAPLAVHVHENRAEVARFESRAGLRPFAACDRAGLLRPGFLALHATHLNEAEIELAARSGVAVVHCPRANARHGEGIAPLAALRRRGIVVALGTEGGPGLGTSDLLAEARLATELAGATAGRASAPAAHEALRMATLDGAALLGLGHDVGSLLAGKSADLICLDLGEAAPESGQLAEHVLHDVAASAVTDVWIAGRAQLRNGRLVTLDAAELAATRRQWSARLGSEGSALAAPSSGAFA